MSTKHIAEECIKASQLLSNERTLAFALETKLNRVSSDYKLVPLPFRFSFLVGKYDENDHTVTVVTHDAAQPGLERCADETDEAHVVRLKKALQDENCVTRISCLVQRTSFDHLDANDAELCDMVNQLRKIAHSDRTIQGHHS